MDEVKLLPCEGGFVDLIRDELFDASTSPPRAKGVRYFEAWQTGYDAALNRVLERAGSLPASSAAGLLAEARIWLCSLRNDFVAPVELPDLDAFIATIGNTPATRPPIGTDEVVERVKLEFYRDYPLSVGYGLSENGRDYAVRDEHFRAAADEFADRLIASMPTIDQDGGEKPRYAQPCFDHEYITPGCPDCGKMA